MSNFEKTVYKPNKVAIAVLDTAICWNFSTDYRAKPDNGSKTRN